MKRRMTKCLGQRFTQQTGVLGSKVLRAIFYKNRKEEKGSQSRVIVQLRFSQTSWVLHLNDFSF